MSHRSGSGSRDGRKSTTRCPKCNGSGVVRPRGVLSCTHGIAGAERAARHVPVPGHLLQVRRRGHHRQGSLHGAAAGCGCVAPTVAQKCQGRGHVKGSKSHVVDIPAGIMDGMQLRIAQDRRSRNEVLVSVKVPLQVRMRAFDAGRCGRAPCSGGTRTTCTARWTLVWRRPCWAAPSRLRACTATSPCRREQRGRVPRMTAAQLQECTKPETVLKFAGKGIASLYGDRKGDHFIHTHIKLPRCRCCTARRSVTLCSKLTLEQKQIMSKWAATESGRSGAVNVVHVRASSLLHGNVHAHDLHSARGLGQQRRRKQGWQLRGWHSRQAQEGHLRLGRA